MTDNWAAPQYLFIAYWLLILLGNTGPQQITIGIHRPSWATLFLGQLATIIIQFAVLRWGGFF